MAKKGFDPRQPRNAEGEWVHIGGGLPDVKPTAHQMSRAELAEHLANYHSGGPIPTGPRGGRNSRRVSGHQAMVAHHEHQHELLAGGRGSGNEVADVGVAHSHNAGGSAESQFRGMLHTRSRVMPATRTGAQMRARIQSGASKNKAQAGRLARMASDANITYTPNGRVRKTDDGFVWHGVKAKRKDGTTWDYWLAADQGSYRGSFFDNVNQALIKYKSTPKRPGGR